MIPSAFAQVQVDITPYKESYHIDEANYVQVKVSKIVPNTDFCTQLIPIISTDKITTIRQSANFDTTISNTMAGGIQKLELPNNMETGNYQVRVFYGNCNTENSFGDNYTRVYFNKEQPSNTSKFIQDNYFPEKIDVGTNYLKSGNWNYDPVSCEKIDSYNHVICRYQSVLDNLESKVSGKWGGITIIIGKISDSNNDNPFPYVRTSQTITSTSGLECVYDSGGRMGASSRSLEICIVDDIAVITKSDYRDSDEKTFDLFMDVITKKIKSNPIPSESKLSSMYSTQSQSVTTTTSNDRWSGLTATSNSEDSLSIRTNECGKGTILKNNLCVVELTCGKGTIEKNGQCVVDNSSSGGGCLIATATYGSEMATEVQQLRELRDNQLLQTESGTAFMSTFNDIYYTFSPIIADMERENPLFKEVVKIAITPMISSLSLMENANSESEVISLGLSVIMLNLGMYLGVPAIVTVGIRKITF
jgi:hypothetical protein